MGFFCTLILLVLIIAYGLKKYSSLTEHDETKYQEYEDRDVNRMKLVPIEETKVRAGFVYGRADFKPIEIDRDLLSDRSFKLVGDYITLDEDRNQQRVEIDYEECNGIEEFELDVDMFPDGIFKALCFDLESVAEKTLSWKFNAKEHGSLSFQLKGCTSSNCHSHNQDLLEQFDAYLIVNDNVYLR